MAGYKLKAALGSLVLLTTVLMSCSFEIKQVILEEYENCPADTVSVFDKLECGIECQKQEVCRGFTFLNQKCHLLLDASDCANCTSLCFRKGTRTTGVLTVSNGLPYGNFAVPEFCPSRSFAGGFKIKGLERRPGGWIEPGTDDSYLNAIKLVCHDTQSRAVSEVVSHPGLFGSWANNYTLCSMGYYIVSFSLKVEPYLGDVEDEDNTAVNNLKVQCRGPGLYGSTMETIMGATYTWIEWGSFGGWSASCEQGQAVCGLSSQVLADQGDAGDDMGLTDLKLMCCTP